MKHSHSYLSDLPLAERQQIASLANYNPRYEIPDDPREAFFDPPSPARAAMLCSKLIAEHDANAWRTPKLFVSVSEGDGPEISDPLPGAKAEWQKWTLTITGLDHFHERYLSVPTGRARTIHTGLVSNSFAFHPLYSTGHILRTNGVIAIFWNGEETAIVEVTNLTPLRVLVASDKPESKKTTRLAAAMLED